MRRLAEFPLVGIWGEKFRSGGSHEDDVFDATGAETGVVKAGLDGHDGVFSQNVINGAAHPGQLVHGETEAMPGAMEKPGSARGRVRSLVAAGGEHFDAFAVNQSAIGTGADSGECRELGGADGGDEGALGFIGPPPQESARHVAVVARGRDAREDVDDDELIWPEGSGAPLMGVAGLVAAGDDGVGRDAARLQNGDLDGELEHFTRHPFPAVQQFPAGDRAGAENVFRGREAEGAESIAFANGGGFSGGFDFACGKERTIGDFEVEAEFAEFLVNPSGEIFWNREARLRKILCEEIDKFGGAEFAIRPEVAGAFHVRFQREDDVERGCFFDPPELERSDHGVFFAPHAEGDERVGHFDATKVKGVGAACGVGVKEGRREGFGSHERAVAG
ncbi:MAG: hypothetical protein RLZZ162_3739 [Verrucomicrobiota bacterium]